MVIVILLIPLAMYVLRISRRNPDLHVEGLEAEQGFLVELINKLDEAVSFDLVNITVTVGQTGVVGGNQFTNLAMGPKEKMKVVIPISRSLESYAGMYLYCAFELQVHTRAAHNLFKMSQNVQVTKNIQMPQQPSAIIIQPVESFIPVYSQPQLPPAYSERMAEEESSTVKIVKN